MQTGELERLKEFGITKTMLQEQADAMGIVFQNNKGQITSYENLNTALFAIMEDRYKGSMEIQSKTFRGMVSNAQDMMGAIGRTVGEPIFEAFKDSLENILELGQNLLDSGQIEKWAENVANGIENLIGFAQDVGNAFNWMKENIDALTPVAISIGVAIAAVMTPAIIAWTTATTAAAIAQWALIAPILATVAPILAVGVVIGGLIYVWQTYGNAIKSYVSEAWSNVQTTFNNMISFVSGINLWEIGANMIRGLVDGMLSMLDSAMETAKNIGSGIANTLKNFFQINSPSKLMFSYGGYIGQGLDLGMQSETNNLKATGQSMAKATDGEFTSTTSSSSTSYAPSINITVNGSGGGRETALSVRKEVEKALEIQNKKLMLRLGGV